MFAEIEVPFNPPGRTTKTALAGLLEQIRQHGIIEPVIVTPDLTIIDGHRRVACAKALGIQRVWCRIVDGDPRELYRITNEDNRRLRGVDWLSVHLNGGVVPERHRRYIEMLQHIGGHDLLRRVAERGHGADGVIILARSVARYCGDMSLLGDAVRWLVMLDQAFVFRVARELHTPPAVVRQAVIEHRPLTLR